MSGTILLSRVECLCGRSAAIPEGGFFPLCGGCGRRMVAPPPERRVHYVSEPLSLDDAVARHVEGTSAPVVGPIPGHKPEYTHIDLFKTLRQRGWPTNPPEWPVVPSLDGGSHGVPPWEVPA